MKMEGYKWKAIPEKDQNEPFPEERDSPATQVLGNSHFFFKSKTFVRSGIRTHAHIRGPEYSC